MRLRRAIEPPPAPISIRSTTGTWMVMPLPRWKRCTRPTSKVGTTSAWPFWIRQDLAVVPPMSKQNMSGRSKRLLKYWPAITAALGPDSMMRTGKAAATSAEVTPPEESMMNSRRVKPSAARRSRSERR
ncbi:MAG: hypothetical protein U1F06_00805 [Steroidobacteraceae bacterium]